MEVVTITEKLSIENCIACGMAFGMPSAVEKGRRRDHKSFYCPNGHGQHYAAENEEEKLRRQLTDAMARETSLRDESDRIKRRIANGVCPCCNRTFKHLGRHMKNKHPTFK